MTAAYQKQCSNGFSESFFPILVELVFCGTDIRYLGPPCFFIHRCLHTFLSRLLHFITKLKDTTYQRITDYCWTAMKTADLTVKILIAISLVIFIVNCLTLARQYQVVNNIITQNAHIFSEYYLFQKKKEVLTLALAWRGRSSPWAFARRMGEGPSRRWSKRPFQSLGRYGLGWHYAWQTWFCSPWTERPPIRDFALSPNSLCQLPTFLLHRCQRWYRHRPRCFVEEDSTWQPLFPVHPAEYYVQSW